jgi:flagellar protein FlbD
MISLTRPNGSPIVLNGDLIETIEANGETIVTLTTGNVVVVRDSPQEIAEKVTAFKRAIYAR